MRKKVLLLLFLFVCSMMLFALHRYSPHDSHWYPPCFFKKTTGFDCPGCGGTRACYHLLHGNISAAANYNFLLLIMLPIMVVGVGALLSKHLQTAWTFFNRPVAILAIVLLFWAVRNLPYYPFEWLHSDK